MSIMLTNCVQKFHRQYVILLFLLLLFFFISIIAAERQCQQVVTCIIEQLNECVTTTSALFVVGWIDFNISSNCHGSRLWVSVHRLINLYSYYMVTAGASCIRNIINREIHHLLLDTVIAVVISLSLWCLHDLSVNSSVACGQCSAHLELFGMQTWVSQSRKFRWKTIYIYWYYRNI